MTGYRHGVQDEKLYKSRSARAQLVSVDPVKGTATVVLEGTRVKHADVPLPLAVSVAGRQTSWARYMPDDLSWGEVTYDAAGRPRVSALVPASYAETAARGGLPPGDAGKLSPWYDLQKGEADVRSAGGAGWHATREGRLELFAGRVVVAIDKDRHELAVEDADRLVASGGGSRAVVGEVFRKATPAALTPIDVATGTVVPGDAFPLAAASPLKTAPAAKEWRVQLGAQHDPTGLAPFGTVVAYPALYEEWAGDLRSDSSLTPGMPVPGPFFPVVAARLAYRKTLYGGTVVGTPETGAVPVFQTEIDSLGNVKVTIAPLAGTLPVLGAGGVVVDASPPGGAPALVPLGVTFGSVRVRATGAPPPGTGVPIALDLGATAGLARLDGSAGTIISATVGGQSLKGGVKLGGIAATHPLVHGDVLLVALQAIAGALAPVSMPVTGTAVASAITGALAPFIAPGPLGLLSLDVVGT